MKLTSTCLNCQQTFEYHPKSSNGKYCCNKCQQDYQFINVTVPKIEQGLIIHHRVLKRYLVWKYGDKCSECHNEATWNSKPISHHVDHVDGNSDNNLPSNLRLLCPNCHSQQPTSKDRTKKNCKRNKYLRQYKNGTE